MQNVRTILVVVTGVAFHSLLDAPDVSAQVIRSHIGSINPTDEGWQQSGDGLGITERTVPGGWVIDDASFTDSGRFYTSSLTPEEIERVQTEGWVLRTILDVSYGDCATGSITVSFSDGAKAYTMVFSRPGQVSCPSSATLSGGPHEVQDDVVYLQTGIDASGCSAFPACPLVDCSGGSGGSFATRPTGPHTFELIYDPLLAAVILQIDGTAVNQAFPYEGHASNIGHAGWDIIWGANSTCTTGAAIFHLVEFQIGSQCNILVNGGFEENDYMRIHPYDQGGIWFGSRGAMVPETLGIIPPSGNQMFKFVSGCVPDTCATDGCYAFAMQLADLTPYVNTIEAGRFALEVSALVNRVAGDDETDTLFSLSVFPIYGTVDQYPVEFNSYDERYVRGDILADGTPHSWEPLSVRACMPPYTESVAILLYVTENVFNDYCLTGPCSPPQFDGHFVDRVRCSILVVPPGDSDCDNDLDLRDIAEFGRCLSDLPRPTNKCVRSDVDGDGTVSLRDFTRLAAELTGPQQDRTSEELMETCGSGPS